MEKAEQADIIIMGAGIAGASLAFELAGDNKVMLLEQESQPGYHSTGRSAAMFIETYGSAVVQWLTRQGRSFFEAPPAGFAGPPLLSPRGYLQIAKADQLDQFGRQHKASLAIKPGVRRLDAVSVCKTAPLINPSSVEAGLLEADAKAIDVATLHQGYLKGFAEKGGRLITDAEIRDIKRDGDGWTVAGLSILIRASILVNAAGAWADRLASLAGIRPIGLQPKRRTAILIDPPAGLDLDSLPMIADIDYQFYVKPEGRQLLVSPADETPSPPTDAQPEEFDVATAVDRYETLTGERVKKVNHRWSGLRSFVRDGDPVIGVDPDHPSFYWLAGQGGSGIMTAPGAARFSAAVITGQPLSAEQKRLTNDLAPSRLR